MFPCKSDKTVNTRREIAMRYFSSAVSAICSNFDAMTPPSTPVRKPEVRRFCFENRRTSGSTNWMESVRMAIS
ncbi:hypothetical protein L596_012503 [Steinernema carpocapsae]|uniref:Uncharacterized protein n=1 Tax=Steinernema carpocapsae TaxID=34508 RepID=A0A4U5NY45_STECR|nr:hypothetical protein L596_012503 [Steinernema carpocapsae]